jgi:hypothetical protein
MDDSGNMWLAWPRPVDPKSVYLIQPVPVEQNAPCEAFRFNADYFTVDGTQDPWLYTSGFEGPASFKVTLSSQKVRQYKVRFHFAETQDAPPGARVFDVKIQGKKVLAGLDVAKEAGGARRALAREVAGVSAKETMVIELLPIRGKPPLLCSLEVIEQ